MENRNITDEELEALKATKTAQEWNDSCDAIKKARDGAYPADWWPRVVKSGLMHLILSHHTK